jgi:predicted RNase H-like HicB family nuclease
MKYVYPAIFEKSIDGGYSVSFPDLPGSYSQGNSQGEALDMARSALTQWLEYLTDKKQTIPAPSDISDVVIDCDGFVSLVMADIRDSRAVKRTVSLPKWMDEKVSEMGLSLSRVLQDAIAKKIS